MKIRLPKSQNNNKEAKKLSLEKLLEGYKDTKKVLYYYSLLWVSKVIRLKLISGYHDYFLAGHVSIKKIQDLIVKKYY